METKPTGHRKMTPGRVRAEILAKSFKGFGSFTPRMAMNLVRDYAVATLSHSALRLYLYMLKTNEKGILGCPEDPEFTSCSRFFSFFAKNDLITAKTGLQVKTIQRGLRALEDAGFIWCNDNGSRNRTPANGICLLPAFARLVEMKDQVDGDMLDLELARQQRRQLSAAKAEIIALRDAIISEDQLQVHDASLFEGLVDLADAAIRNTSGTGFMDTMLVLTRSLSELKNLYVAFSEGQMSPSPVKNVAPITYKISSLKRDVEALREMELSQEPEPDVADVQLEQPEAGQIFAPKAKHLVQGIKALMSNDMFPKMQQAELSDEDFVRKCGTIAAMQISINPRASTLLREKYGQTEAASLLIHAAADPKIRHRGAWAAHFAYSKFNKPIDINGSFFRMIKDIDRAATAGELGL